MLQIRTFELCVLHVFIELNLSYLLKLLLSSVRYLTLQPADM
jgi:hypothetical protein